MKRFILGILLFLCTTVVNAQTNTPSVMEVYKVHLYSSYSDTYEVLDVNYMMIISDGVIKFDNKGSQAYKVNQKTIRIVEENKATIIYSRGVDNTGRFVDMKLYMSPEKAYLLVDLPSGIRTVYYFTTLK